MAHLQRFSSAMKVLSIGLLLLSGCQLMTKHDNSSTSYGEYYLILQQLNQQQLTNEVSKQQKTLEKPTKKNSQMHYDAQIKLLLLYSLPTSPIYNVFNAKVLLNELNSEDENAALANINPSDQAFISLLRDQLNQCLLMRSRLLAQQQELQQAQRQQAIKQQETLIEQVKLLEQTIKQLKNIEQAIDKRDQ
ncbi:MULTISPECIES: hypothetical protein [unclassified Colwellia]|uniref:hypothetical protein n=1 Tax=unclassified Colwellia TaxID=196834 RepID=UPI0015F4DCA7|nr:MULTISPECIES: hypothetical protein [unclassified Colwellia]MBA6223396.1 hypothetical protein [Colwellia sp. MB3u-45]MBA6267924.1 hypothetical protein [Colwellia sp. MB3u-43]MBA6289758.1 hypothetical protein [Colwellia sp. MB3u-4]MBA6322222.1 hypothetical protein [Colwellia sp. MB02u-19]MBA6323965.1 hypothetical protein [Colwellia sp. MB02u-18]